MKRCVKCNRPLKREPVHGMGPVCARSMYGAKPKRVRADRKPDVRQGELWAEAAQ